MPKINLATPEAAGHPFTPGEIALYCVGPLPTPCRILQKLEPRWGAYSGNSCEYIIELPDGKCIHNVWWYALVRAGSPKHERMVQMARRAIRRAQHNLENHARVLELANHGLLQDLPKFQLKHPGDDQPVAPMPLDIPVPV